MAGIDATFFNKRLSVAIDIARIFTMFLIVSGHYMQLYGFYSHYTDGSGYPFQPQDISAYIASLASQTWLCDKIFLVADYGYWSLNYTFFALSGLSLWHATRSRGLFDLKDYYYKRLKGVYLGYSIAALAAFWVGVSILGHSPGEHDLNYLLLGVPRARETAFYNDTLWFMSVLFVLYLVYPFIVYVYSKLGPVGLFILWLASAYFFLHKHALATKTFIPTGFTFFMSGIALMEFISILKNTIQRHIIIATLTTAGIGILCVMALHDILYSNIIHINRYEYDTHATGSLFFLTFISAGLLFPVKPGSILRNIGAATFPVYLFHYLAVRLYNNHQGFHNAAANLKSLAVWPLGESILAASLAIFLVLLCLGVAYNRFVIAPLVRGIDKAFNQPFTLRRAK